MKKKHRSIIVAGSSLAVTLPKDWLLKEGIQKGDTVVLEQVGSGILVRKVQDGAK